MILRRTAPFVATTLISACQASPDDTGSGGADSWTDCGDPCVLSDDNNYDYASILDVEAFTLKSEADIEITWPNLTTDLLGDPIEPSEIDQVKLVVFGDLAPDEVADALATDTATQAQVDLYQLCEPTEPVCMLSQFELLGSNIYVPQYFDEGTGTWLIALARSGNNSAVGMAFMQASDDAEKIVVEIDDDTFSLEVDADLQGLRPIGLVADTTTVVDWSGLTVDGFGNEMAERTLDLLEVARYDEPLGELESRFIDIEHMADEVWSADVSGAVRADLGDLSGDVPFTGIDRESTWLLALRCSSCLNPAPRFMTVMASPD